MCATSMGIVLLGILALLGFGFFAPVSMETSPDVRQAIEPTVIAELGGPSAQWHEVLSIAGGCGDIFAVDWSPDGSRLVGGCDDGTVRIWDANTGCAAPHARRAYRAGLDRGLVAGWGVDRQWQRGWHDPRVGCRQRQEPITMQLNRAGSGSALSNGHPTCRLAVASRMAMGLSGCGCRDGDYQSASELRGHEYTVNDVSWLHFGNPQLVSGGGSGYPDNTVRLWDCFGSTLRAMFSGGTAAKSGPSLYRQTAPASPAAAAITPCACGASAQANRCLSSRAITGP